MTARIVYRGAGELEDTSAGTGQSRQDSQNRAAEESQDSQNR
jgi:hypothetical protein